MTAFFCSHAGLPQTLEENENREVKPTLGMKADMENPAFRKPVEVDSVKVAPRSPVFVVDEMALRRSVIFNEGRLKYEEKLFLDMVRSGDILNLRDLLLVSPEKILLFPGDFPPPPSNGRRQDLPRPIIGSCLRLDCKCC